MHRYILTLLFFSPACTSPQDRCIAQNAKDIRVIDDLITTTSRNIERGYAMEIGPQTNVGIQFCAGGNIFFCADTPAASKQTPVAIDQELERRKLAELKAKRATLQRQAGLHIAACQAKHPG